MMKKKVGIYLCQFSHPWLPLFLSLFFFTRPRLTKGAMPIEVKNGTTRKATLPIRSEENGCIGQFRDRNMVTLGFVIRSICNRLDETIMEWMKEYTVKSVKVSWFYLCKWAKSCHSAIVPALGAPTWFLTIIFPFVIQCIPATWPRVKFVGMWDCSNGFPFFLVVVSLLRLLLSSTQLARLTSFFVTGYFFPFFFTGMYTASIDHILDIGDVSIVVDQ